MRYWLLLLAPALLLGGSAVAEPGNVIATTAVYQSAAIRGYTCATWAFLPTSERTSYILGVVALADALYASDRLDYAMDEAVRLPLSASAYRPLVDAGCLYVPASTPVLAVLYSLK
ncbi:MAG: hypothetical protein QN173_06520 [Armatimonadota bacterium]|nr:hypothetical protein [Armatimonadota bacterium]MDR7472867.1 hypothetical protein [Armatimonadota bacterium]MDR7507243.1 hypothetical protein [Armatimonadota bacterium]MDR7508948.1 hypothetical protein [Armatimonadota bacterium]